MSGQSISGYLLGIALLQKAMRQFSRSYLQVNYLNFLNLFNILDFGDKNPILNSRENYCGGCYNYFVVDNKPVECSSSRALVVLIVDVVAKFIQYLKIFMGLFGW